MTRDKPPEDTTQRTLFSPGPDRPAPRSACVVVIHGEGLGKRVDIHDRPILIGRVQDADLLIEHKSVSRRHCRIWRDGGRCQIEDLGATNLTRVNDLQLEQAAILADGDRITVGESILKFISQDSVEASYHEEIYQLAVHDPLTELYNRRHFCEVADKEIARATRHERPLALCIIDVDLFKPVNDRYGHIAGDDVLRQIGLALRAHARGDDVAARIGGEEFAMLLPETAIADAEQSAQRLRAAIETMTFTLGGEARKITVSIGIASLTPDRAARGPLMAAADAALYRAKREGRNRACIAD